MTTQTETAAILQRQFTKKPATIEAIQWTGRMDCLNAFDIPELQQSLGSQSVEIYTLEGVMRADVGDWIIKGVKGEFYPCKPDIFALSYDAAQPAPVSGEVVDRPDLIAACRNLVAYLDQHPPMADSLWCVQQIRAALPAPQAPVSQVAGDRVSDNAIIAHDFLKWNRSQKEPLVAITKELFVAAKVLEIAANLAARQAPDAVRDAALEEAARLMLSYGASGLLNRFADDIRALRSTAAKEKSS